MKIGSSMWCGDWIKFELGKGFTDVFHVIWLGSVLTVFMQFEKNYFPRLFHGIIVLL